MGKLYSILTVLVVFFVASQSFASEKLTRMQLDSLLLRIDNFRGLPGDHRCDLEISLSENGSAISSNRYRLRIHPSPSGRDVLLRALSPEAEKGNLILSQDNAMWILTRRTSRAVPVSVQQRLLGDASIGDVLNVQLQGQYQGSSSVHGDVRTLELEALHAGTLYERIQLSVDASTSKPQEARFLTRSGRLIKTLRYQKFLHTQGRELATELSIIDATAINRRTHIQFSRYTSGKFSAGTFDKDNLRNLTFED